MQSMLSWLAPAQATGVYLGDLIDKRPESRRALDFARRGLAGAQNHRLLCIHEDRLLRLLDAEDPPAFSRWMQHGGRALLDEFGVSDLAEWCEGVRDGLDTSTIERPLRRQLGLHPRPRRSRGSILRTTTGSILTHVPVETGILSALVIHENRMRLVQTIPA
ncbi:hypothetical protein NDN01_00185 [Sphingomonas sp. QA11]|uniref:hypothetical protein n=1 Tax=Sphingomonas sp. QA11 TaxID=2950605 RepID=UPI00234A58C5|nr:hypothetical protein [Sphingomonas sp. QA11]WCM27394.1 hypothetical protein NDN01_00185 [Sphingomonas sp. QA11]